MMAVPSFDIKHMPYIVVVDFSRIMVINIRTEKKIIIAPPY